MGIKLVINGFFRSGTTVMWEIFKKSNPDMYVFYEPCNGRLLENIEQLKKNKTAHKVHGTILWEEYLRIPRLLEKIKSKHPNINAPFPIESKLLINYFNLFAELDKNSVLQTNRIHFFMQDVHRLFGCHLIHIIRNPVRVYSSMQKFYRYNGLPVSILFKLIFTPFVRYRAFRVHTLYKYICTRLVEGPNEKSFFQKYLLKFKPFDMFLITWTLANYYAMIAIQEADGIILCHEDLVNNRRPYRRMIEERTGLRFKEEGILKSGQNEIFLNDNEKSKLLNKAKKLNIGKEFKFIIHNYRMKAKC